VFQLLGDWSREKGMNYGEIGVVWSDHMWVDIEEMFGAGDVD